MVLLFIFFIFLFFVYFKNKSLAWLLIIIQLFSAGGSFFMGKDLIMEDLTDYAYILLSCVLLFLIISPWKSYYDAKEFIEPNSKKLKLFTRFLIIVNSIAFVILSIITYIVQTTVVDINKFKYSEGVGADFIASHLPFPNVFFSLAIMLSYFGYFILPLHFYYLYKKRFLLSLVCFILSLNIMLVGLTYFSRAAVLQYIFVYLFMLYLHYNIYNKFIKRNIKIGMIITSVVAVMYFINVSVLRFQEDASLAKSYSKTIPVDAVTQDPLTYSFLDYMSQGYLNGFEVLKIYKGEGFNGTLTFEKVIGLISNDSNATYNRLKYRQKLWPREYSYSFNGFPAYVVYDYGILGSILVCLLYFLLINKLKPKNGVLDLRNVFIIVVLIQIPIMSIFYSEIGGSIIAILLCIPVWIYFKYNIKNA